LGLKITPGSETLRWGPYSILLLTKPSLSEENCYGVYNGQPPRVTIEILDGLSPSITSATMFHELVHAVDESLGLGLTEKAVRGVEVGMCSILQQNPEWARRWLEGLLETP